MSHTVIVSSILGYGSLFLMILLFLVRFSFSFERVSCSYILLFPLSFIAASFFSSAWSSIISFLFLVKLLVEYSLFSVWLYKLVLFFCISSSSCFARFSLTSFSFFLFSTLSPIILTAATFTLNSPLFLYAAGLGAHILQSSDILPYLVFSISASCSSLSSILILRR